MVSWGMGDEGGRGLATRLARLADELGVGDGVQVAEREGPAWNSLFEDHEPARYDGVFVVAPELPAALDDPAEPDDALIEALAGLLADSETRFLILQPPAPEAVDRRDALCLRLAERGSPPAVVVPREWDVADAEQFAEGLFERLLHDSPLTRAVSDATAGMTPPAVVYQPPGRRHGLDLARLLEDHRRRIEEGGSALRMFLRELEAARPEGPPSPEWTHVADRATASLEQLEEVKAAVEEINRDRDPAGWSRLSKSIARLAGWEDELERSRNALEATRTSGE